MRVQGKPDNGFESVAFIPFAWLKDVNYKTYQLIKSVFIILFLSSINLSFCQNLVYNGDFELFDTCPDNVTQVERSLGWVKPTQATSDYFNSCAPISTGASLPSGNFAQYQEAQSGNAYMGIIGYYTSFPQNEPTYLWIEYIQGGFLQNLEKDTLYLATFYINMGNYSNVANKRIGIYFSSAPISSNNTLPFYEQPQVMTSDYVVDTLNWIKVSQYFIADGTEQFLTIGNFFQNGSLDTMVIEQNDPPFMSSYYLVDNVSVVKAGFEVPNIVTNNGDGINDKIDFTFLPNSLGVVIVNRWGNLVFESKDSNMIWDPTDLTEGVYFYCLKDKNTLKAIKTGFIQLIR